MSIRKVLQQLAAAREKIDEARTHPTNADTTINSALGLLHAAADSTQDEIRHAAANPRPARDKPATSSTRSTTPARHHSSTNENSQHHK